MFNLRPDKGDASLGTALGKAGALGKEPISRMHRIASRGPRRLHHRLFVEVGRRSDPGQRMGVIGHPNMQARGIVLRVHGNTLDAKVRGRTSNPNGNLAPVGDQQLHGPRLPPFDFGAAPAMMASDGRRRA